MINPYSFETMIAEMKFKLSKSDDAAAEYFNDCLREVDFE